MFVKAGVISQTHKSSDVIQFYYRAITLDQPASDLTDFPVLISGTYEYLKSVANGGFVKDVNGYDITFYSSDFSPLDFERQLWDDSTGEIEFWVRIPTLTSASPTVIYIAYGSDITYDHQNNNTWSSDYLAVWHMNDLSSPAIESNNGLDAVEVGTITFGSTGKINKATSYNNNTSNYLGITSAAFELTSALTLSAWAKFNNTGSGLHGIIDKTIAGATNTSYQLFTSAVTPTFRLTKATAVQTIAADSTYSIDTWYHLAGTWDGTTMKMFVDGVQQAQTLAVAAPIDSGSGELKIGTLGSSVFPMDGYIDELRVLTVARSADWIAAEHSNQNDPANFYTIDLENFELTYDIDAYSFIQATGITDDTQKSAINTLVKSAKTNGWWSKCRAIYPFIGGTASAHKYNLKDPRDLDAAYRLIFAGGWTHSPTGADPDGVFGTYASTHLVINGTILSPMDVHLSHYSRENTYTVGITCAMDIGAYQNTCQIVSLANMCDYGAGVVWIGCDSITVNGTTASADAYFMATRVSPTDCRLIRNGSQLGSTLTTDLSGSYANLTVTPIYIATGNIFGNWNSNKECAFATIGEGIDTTLAAVMYADIQAYQTTLGRQV